MTLCQSLCAALALVICLLAGCDRSATSAATSASEGSDQAPGNSKSDRVVEATFDDIKFDTEPGDPFDRSLLTPKIEELFGRRIRIRGFMFPTLKKRGLTQFVLVRDNLECCFGPGAALFDCILVHMEPGHTAEFSIRPIAVEGTFSLDEVIGPDGNHLAIYRLDADKAGN